MDPTTPDPSSQAEEDAQQFSPVMLTFLKTPPSSPPSMNNNTSAPVVVDDDGDNVPPRRVQSSNSLFGEDILVSGPMYVTTSGNSAENNSNNSYSDDDDEDDDAGANQSTTTPPSLAEHLQLSPPALSYTSGNGNGYHSDNNNYDNNGYHHHTTSSLGGGGGGGGTGGSFMKKGRPPLAAAGQRLPQQPGLVLRNTSGGGTTTTTTGRGHKRGPGSTGEFSFLSALTDPEQEDDQHNVGDVINSKQPSQRRDRSVSWDEAAAAVGANSRAAEFFHLSPNMNLDDDEDILMGDSSILQPILIDEPPRSIVTEQRTKMCPSNISTPTARNNNNEPQKSPTPPTSRFAQVVMDNFMTSPLEDEAEKAILQALERSQEAEEPQTAPVDTFPHVTAAVAEAFRKHSQRKLETQISSLASPRQSGDTSDPSQQQVRVINSMQSIEESQTSNPKIQLSPSQDTNTSHPSISRKPSVASSPKPTKSHRRVNTFQSAMGVNSTEGKLVGMATALRQLHHREERKHEEKQTEESNSTAHKRWEKLAGSDIGTIAAEPPKQQQAGTTTDQLVNNAVLLFRGKSTRQAQHPDTLGDSETSTINANNNTDPKKNDDVMVEDYAAGGTTTEAGGGYCDVEMGGGGESPSRHESTTTSTTSPTGRKNRRKKKTRYEKLRQGAKSEWKFFIEFVRPRQRKVYTYARALVFYIHIPLLLISALFYYLLGNPTVRFGYVMEPSSGEAIVDSTTGQLVYPSVSWFILFLLRQTITFVMSKATEIMIVDFLALKTAFFLYLCGPLVTLCIIQAKGWPMMAFWWSFYDLLLLSGKHRFAKHWIFYQSLLGIFSEENPAGGITDSLWNYRLLFTALVVSIAVAIKRFYVGIRLGTRQFNEYGGRLAKILHEMIVISEVSVLAQDIADEADGSTNSDADFAKSSRAENHRGSLITWGSYSETQEPDEDAKDIDDEVRRRVKSSIYQRPSLLGSRGLDPHQEDSVPERLSSSEKFKIHQLLEQWEEPVDETQKDASSVHAVMQFKQTLAFMDLTYPFSRTFGIANTRENCVESAQQVYNRLLKSRLNILNPELLSFDTLAELARKENGELDEKSLKLLVRLFRPNRDGTLTKLDFIKSIDKVYKSLKLLRAAIHNSSQIDAASEGLINVVFYFVVACIVLSSWKIDPLSLFLSLSSVLLALTFAIGSASAKFCEGLLFIINRRPYDIGDRIAICSPEGTPSMSGESSWFVEKVTLYHTELRLAGTNEVATIANASLANARVINAARSPKALVYVFFKFGIDVSYSKFQVFKDALENFVKQRPREWLSVSAIMATRVEADMGYVEYAVTLQHRESWQNLLTVLQSKAAVVSYGLELLKKLDMRYLAPPTPVDLNIKDDRLARLLQQQQQQQGPPSPERSGNSRPSPYRLPDVDPRDRIQSTDLRGLADMFAVTSPQGGSH